MIIWESTLYPSGHLIYGDSHNIYNHSCLTGTDFPINSVEFLYPVQPIPTSNTSVSRTDDLVWKGVDKSSSQWKTDVCVLAFRIRNINMSSVMNFIKSNWGSNITLNIPGVQPFFTANEENTVVITNYTDPTREREFYWRTDITFRLI